MRPSQQKNRMRGRGRKQPNPLSRSYESNGPDVKIRGNASHIADKYAALARDAAASGDRVMAENYLQHAEHYSRIIAAATAASNRNEENAAKAPQPDVPADDNIEQNESVAADSAKSDASNGAGDQPGGPEVQDGGEGDTSPTPKRESRGRRNRTKRTDGDGRDQSNGNAGANGGHETIEPKSEVTDDAAKLPGSLIGLPDGAGNSDSSTAQDE